ncbi:MAG: D-aminoacyl-tRNA deacylase [Corynebacterium flavescens]|uniref:D-aminoacyl-tRNA deacylase n=1 Tax=Corynebacterium flavescens TaxID=28028 RepID=UPI003F996993
MRAVITRVSHASVRVEGEVVGSIDAPSTGGLLVLLGVSREDLEEWESRAEKMARKIAELRILDGETSVSEAHAPVLLISQFTLYGRTAKGRRPSWSDAAPGEAAEPIINAVITALRARSITVAEGQFGALMSVSSVNEGPFTVLVET